MKNLSDEVDKMITTEQARQLATDWITAWNAHDLDRILTLYTDDFGMASPYIVQIAGRADGRLLGKAAVGDYWRKALEKYPDLHFDLIDVLVGADSVVLYYRSIGGRMAAEIFVLDTAGRIASAAAHYA
ncbi:MAG: nuclear transport factor 2 family protein [Panacagrimonas sp.]